MKKEIIHGPRGSASLEEIACGIYRLLIPFEDLTTTVYIEKRDTGVGIIDCATYSEDVDEYILPAIRALSLTPQDVGYVALTHRHGDHAGGRHRARAVFPSATLYAHENEQVELAVRISDGDAVGGFVALHLPGHTTGSMGFLDRASGMLLSGDCLQLRGIGKYRGGVVYTDLYRASVARLRSMNISRIVAAHEYDPLGSIADGAAVGEYLDECIAAIEK